MIDIIGKTELAIRRALLLYISAENYWAPHKQSDSPIPEKRTEEYYKKRPCAELVGMAAAIMENYIVEHPISSV